MENNKSNKWYVMIMKCLVIPSSCHTGSVLSSLTRSNAKIHKAREEAKNIIHAFHKAQDKLELVKVSIIFRVVFYSDAFFSGRKQ